MPWHEGARRLDHDEFVSWASVTKAFAHLPFVSKGLSERLVARLKSGELEAAANANWQDGAASLSTGLVVLVPQWWSGVDSGHPSHYANLWKSGQIALYVPNPETGAITQVRFSGVRFKPSELIAALAPEAQAKPPVGIKPLRDPPPPQASTARAAEPRHPQPEIDDPHPSITTDEYNRWLSVAAVVKIFANEALSIGLFGPRLMKRLLDGEVVAIAETYTRRRGAEKEVLLHHVIPAELWARAAPDDAFWRMNEIDIRVPSNSRYPDVIYTLRGVKLRPKDISRMLGRDVMPDPPVTPIMQIITASPRPATDGDAAEADVRGWYQGLSPDDQAKGIRWLWSEAKEALRPLKVYRKQIEPFVEGRQKGRPRKS